MQLNEKYHEVFQDNIIPDVNKYRRFFSNLFYLFKTTLFIIRDDWLWYLLMVCIKPLSLLIFFGFYFGGKNDEVILFIITGNMVLSLVTGTMLALGQNLGMLKHYKAFDYYATLPISKISLIIALVTRTTLLAIPSMVMIFLIGHFFFGVQMVIHPVILLIIFLGGYSLSGIGAVIGIYSRNLQTASLVTQIVQPFVVYLAPVLIPVDYLPKILRSISYLIPTTYVAKAFRFAVMGKVAYIEILIIFLISVVSIYLVGMKLDWRVEN